MRSKCVRNHDGRQSSLPEGERRWGLKGETACFLFLPRNGKDVAGGGDPRWKWDFGQAPHQHWASVFL